MKMLITKWLTICARRVIHRYQPRIIGVTGSQGKTSTREAIVSVLASAGFSIDSPRENYNNEIGFPLGILGMKSPGSSAVGWLGVVFSAGLMAFGSRRPFPKMLVLEYGVDHPGDMNHLCSIALPEIAVITGISTVHAEHFASREALVEEKALLAQRVREGGVVIVNADDREADALVKKVSVPVIRYGMSSADVVVEDVSLVTYPDAWFSQEETATVLSLVIRGQENTYAFSIHNVAGKPVALTAAAAIAVAEYLHVDVVDLLSALSKLKSAPGRMQLLAGIKGSLILDDSYNASPLAMRSALQTLGEFDPQEGARRIAVLGSMAELGRYSEDEHRQIGFAVAEAGVDLLVCIGELARDIARSAEEAGLSKEQIEEFATSVEAGKWLDPHVRSGDVILVKGSQSSRTEKVVKEIMAEPLRAEELLVRQYGGWLKEG